MSLPTGRTVLVWGALGSGNFGDRLLVDVGQEIATQATGLPATPMWARNKAYDPPGVGIPYAFLPAASDLRRAAGFLVAGGTHVHGGGSAGRALLPLRAMIAAVAAGVPAVALGIGADPSPASDHWVADALALTNLATVRDEASFDRWSTRCPTLWRGRDLVDEALRNGLLSVGPSTVSATSLGFAPSAHLLERWAPSRAEAVRWLRGFLSELRTSDHPVVLLESAPVDAELLDQIDLQGLQRVALHGVSTDRGIAVIGGLAGLLTMRFHIGLLAQRGGVPVAVLGADPKLDALRGVPSPTWPPPSAGAVVADLFDSAAGVERASSGSDTLPLLSGIELTSALDEALRRPPTLQQRRQAANLLARVVASRVLR